jgi:polyphenol oxidase
MTFPSVCHPWNHGLPWLFAATTVRLDGEGHAQDFRLPDSAASWDRLCLDPSFPTVVHAQQVHGATVRLFDAPVSGPPTRHTWEGVDGHLTAAPGALLAVTVADCVPVFLVSEAPQAVALLHAGWRGTAAGILEEGVAQLREAFGAEPSRLHLHLGPAISGARYEVTADVFHALGDVPPGPRGLLDLRAHLARRALRLGLAAERIHVSPLCTLDDPRFYSHRGGDAGRQVALLGIRSVGGGA